MNRAVSISAVAILVFSTAASAQNSTPIGLPGPPHIPLGQPAQLVSPGPGVVAPKRSFARESLLQQHRAAQKVADDAIEQCLRESYVAEGPHPEGPGLDRQRERATVLLTKAIELEQQIRELRVKEARARLDNVEKQLRARRQRLDQHVQQAWKRRTGGAAVAVFLELPEGTHQLTSNGLREFEPTLRLKLGGLQIFQVAGFEQHPGLAVEMTVEIPDDNKVLREMAVRRSGFRVKVTSEDLDQVATNHVLLKAIYLSVASGKTETLLSTRLNPGVDLREETRRRGELLGMLRLRRSDQTVPDTAQSGADNLPGMLPEL